jgi:hypothetical protein
MFVRLTVSLGNSELELVSGPNPYTWKKTQYKDKKSCVISKDNTDKE